MDTLDLLLIFVGLCICLIIVTLTYNWTRPKSYTPYDYPVQAKPLIGEVVSLCLAWLVVGMMLGLLF